MSDLLHPEFQKTDHPLECWSPGDQLQVALEASASIVNPQAVSLALGMSLSPRKMPAFISGRWLESARLMVPTSGGVPLRAGRLKVMPVFTDAEAVRAWLPTGRLVDHPCFGPPPDGLAVTTPESLGSLRDEAGAVMIVLNPAGPGGYQIDPEDGALDDLDWDQSGDLEDSPRPGIPAALPPRPGALVPTPAEALIDPAGRQRLRLRIQAAMDQAGALVGAGRDPEATSLLAASDRLAELMGDYLHRAEMMMMAVDILGRAGRSYAAGRLAHYAVLASSLAARGRLEMEAVQLRARFQ